MALILLVLSMLHGISNGEYYYENWCAQHDLTYLDDSKCQKLFPSLPTSGLVDTAFQCSANVNVLTPEEQEGLLAKGYLPETSLDQLSIIDSESLANIISSNVNLCMIVTKRVVVSDTNEVKLYNKYFCNGVQSVQDSFETWSSSKVFAMANAAGHMRSDEECFQHGDTICQQGQLGLDGYTKGQHGDTRFADLATVIVSYDETMNYTSNSLSHYFLNIGWRERENDLIQDWLGHVNAEKWTPQEQTFGGAYGEVPPADLQYQDYQCALDVDPANGGNGYANHLSALSNAELLRRLVLHREMENFPSLQWPGVTYTDVQNILYGSSISDSTSFFPDVIWGGMSTDPGIFLQGALDDVEKNALKRIDENSDGAWRIFSKLGAGYSSSRGKGEILSNVYACLPHLFSTDSSDASNGIEFTFSVRASEDKDVSLVHAQQAIMDALTETMQALMRGDLPV